MGDAGWETPYAVVDGVVPGLVLGDQELAGLRCARERRPSSEHPAHRQTAPAPADTQPVFAMRTAGNSVKIWAL